MNYSRKIWLLVIAVIVPATIMVLSSCNAQKKNTAAARQYTAFITRYNIYYNGDTHYKETLKNMESKYEDDYSRLVYMHPVEAKSDAKSPQPSGDFNRSIEKAQKAIQLRSIKKKPAKKAGKSDPKYKAWMAREEYNPFLHNAWMMMGRSQYFNGDFLGAASTFFYVVKHFTWLPATVTEAKLWQAQSYISLDWLYEAEVIISRIKEDELTDNNLKGLYNFVYADFEVKSNEYAKAIPYLENAIKYNSGAQKSRLQFLLGQLYARLGEKGKAYQAYKAAGSSSSVPYRTKFNARIKQSEVYTGDNIEPEVKALKRMTRYDRNKEYLDQIYYAIGNLYLSRGDTLRAIENYELAAEKSTRSGIDKAISQITLGELYFKQHNYEKAQPCYAEAVPQLPETYPDYKLLKRRSDVLDELALYSGNVNLQDSLLHLSSLSDEEQLAIVNKIIEDLKKKEREEADKARREEFLANQASMGSNIRQPGASAPTAFNINADDSWYFYNASTRSAGKTDFQKRWGSRKLEDDWRRRNKSSFNVSDFDSPFGSDNEDDEMLAESDSIAVDENGRELSSEDLEKQKLAEDPHNPEFYLKQIPKTDEEKANSHEIIQEGLYNMGVILKDKLEDFPASLSEFNRLLGDYPDNTYRLDTYYNLYLMFMRQGDKAEAERYRQLILNDFGDSNYGLAMRDPDYLDKLRAMDSIQQALYEQTYDDYLNNRNDRVHAAYETMQETYPLSKIMPKFMFLDALAYVTENNNEQFNAVLRSLLDRYPDTDITPIASAWLKGMAQGKDLHSGSGTNLRGMIWDIHLGNDSTAVSSDSPANFEIDPNQPQLLVFVFPTDRVDANILLYEVARHNFQSFVVKDFDLEQMNFGRLGMLIVKGFDNVSELDNYRRVLSASPTFKLPTDVRPIPISVKNLETMLSEGRSFDDYFRFLQQLDYESTQAAMLQPEDIETLQEAEEAAEAANDNESEPIEEIIEESIETPAIIAPEPVEELQIPSTPTPAIEDETPIEPEPSTEPEIEAPAETPQVAPERPKTEEPGKPLSEKPSQTPAQTPANTPTPAKQPATSTVKEKEPAVLPTLPAKPAAPKRVLPDYDPGSEGDDDPLLN